MSTEELDAFSRTRVFFGHQSVGNNIVHGIELLYADAATAGPAIRPASDLGGEQHFVAHAMVGVNGDPESKLAEFRSKLSGGLAEQVDVVILKFCYVDITQGTDVQAIFDKYSTAMDDISRQHPQLRVVYTTVPLTTEASWKSKLKGLITGKVPPSTADNVAREQYNTLVREKYESTGRLFDIARVESTTPDGNRVIGMLGDTRYFSLDEELSIDNGHLNDSGSKLAAQELVRVVLR